jgi:Uncharacterized protein conserved in bacteria (DUF2059)
MMHNAPGLPVGSFATQGPQLAAADIFSIQVEGKGRHAAEPHKGVDTLVSGANILLALQSIDARNLDPLKAGVVTDVKRMLERTNEALELIVPRYAERFSVAELKEVIALYKSPTGAKFIGAQPQIMQQSIAIGQAWGRRIGEEIQGELRKARGLRL